VARTAIIAAVGGGYRWSGVRPAVVLRARQGEQENRFPRTPLLNAGEDRGRVAGEVPREAEIE
jgi:hypothetical protein